MFLTVENRSTPKESEYLAFMYRKQVEEDRRVTTTFLAKAFEVSPATVTETLQKLSRKKLVDYTPYYGAELTEKGTAEGQKLLRKHRILEVLFVRFLDYDVETACQEASKIDYYCSRELINAICRVYGHPERCPCDKEIFGDAACRGG